MLLSLDWTSLIDAAIFSVLGMVLFVVSLVIYEKMTPYSVKKEIIEKQNIALAIIIGSVALGISLIIAMAHG